MIAYLFSSILFALFILVISCFNFPHSSSFSSRVIFSFFNAASSLLPSLPCFSIWLASCLTLSRWISVSYCYTS